MSGAGITINHKDGQKFEKNQRHRLGIVVPDAAGDLWTYVQLNQDVAFGRVAADVEVVEGTVTAISAAGTKLLKDTNAFSTRFGMRLKGALGFIHAGSGVGTAFYD